MAQAVSSSKFTGYSIEEAARILQFHPDAVRYWLRVGELVGVHNAMGNSWRITPEALVTFLRQNNEMLPGRLPSAN